MEETWYASSLTFYLLGSKQWKNCCSFFNSVHDSQFARKLLAPKKNKWMQNFQLTCVKYCIASKWCLRRLFHMGYIHALIFHYDVPQKMTSSPHHNSLAWYHFTYKWPFPEFYIMRSSWLAFKTQCKFSCSFRLVHFEPHLGINSVSSLFRSVSDVHTLRGVRRKKLLSMPENDSAVYRNFEWHSCQLLMFYLKRKIK